MNELSSTIDEAARDRKILESSAKNIHALLSGSTSPIYLDAVQELVTTGNWKELDNRFFRTLAFGTGGLRGKTIGAHVTSVETGEPQPLGCPQFPCVGTNAMNTYNISRATQGLVTYVKEHFAAAGRTGKPAVCICHDTRFFSREFAELAAKVITDMGCNAYLFEGPRSTPQLSFAVRYVGAQAGINLTASHNPPEYNGYKVYFEDGCQVVEPHASAIIDRVQAVPGEDFTPVPESERGEVFPMGVEIDEAYMARLATLPIDPDLIQRENSLKIVYTPLHGVGAVIIKPMLKRLGFQCDGVEEQEIPDGRFPTVKSPNPENAEALTMAIAQANATGADLVIATDPDDDRMGIAARDAVGNMVLLTGNQIGSIIAWYRVTRFIEMGVINDSNWSRAVLIKTFVTTDLQSAIAAKSGIRCVETLTGFKYIGEKLGKYEAAIPEALRADYRNLSELQTRELRLKYSSFYVFGGEESYGYSGSDFVRDKDGNSAAVMIAEVAAYAKSRGLTLPALLDEIFAEFGVYLERGESLTMDGAAGAASIKALVESYSKTPPTEIDGTKVTSVVNFATDVIHDVEGDRIPSEAMLMITLADGRRIAVRPSGTEPKIKYYMFAVQKPTEGKTFEVAEIASIKDAVAGKLASLWAWLSADADRRLGKA
ncbi:MAG: phospho-sugar mutase [Terrimicrobiaceae bacterium]